MKALYLLDHNGVPQIELYGGEIIFSQKSTIDIIEAASKGNSDEDLYNLGMIVYKERKAQIKREQNEAKRNK